MLVSGHVGEVLRAALGDEIRLGHHQHAEVPQVGQAVVGNDGAVLDAIPRKRPRLPQRGDRDDQLHGRNTVQRNDSALPVPGADPIGQRIEVQIVVVQDALGRRQDFDALAQFAMPARLGEVHHILGSQVGGRVGDTGDTERREAPTDLAEPGVAALQCMRPAGVRAAQPAVGMAGQADGRQPRGVQCPQDPAAMLDAHRYIRGNLVEHCAIQRSRDGLVVADGPNPAVHADGGLRQDRTQRVAAAHLPRTDPHRRQRRCRRTQVDVMVV